MNTKNEVNKIKFSYYVAGIILSNVPSFILNSYRQEVLNQIFFPYIFLLSIIILLGSFVAGYLISRKTGEVYQKAGITTGLLSYIVYVLLVFLLRIEMLEFESLLSLFCFVMGAALGARCYLKIKK